ncbi:Uncharacterized membrane protein [Klebsiella pneumoniae]|uniref:Uncharacterized membrane protein n=1 Tax=Klebsiella pneumoniae TaxID=573 RepID=A0A3S4GTD7_KLEPN|nr:Uncharacterized membrane protein [Klebsiella pneumoniae]
MQKKILLVGESWTSTSTHVKGFDQLATATWHTGATDFLAALAESPYAITYMPAHAAATDFPLTLEALPGVGCDYSLGHWRQYAAAASGHLAEEPPNRQPFNAPA